MRKSLVLISLITIFMLAGNVLGASYDIEFSQYEDKILEKHKISLDSVEKLSIKLPEGYVSLDVKNNYEFENGGIVIEAKDIEFSFINPDALEKGNNYYFTRRVEPGIDLTNLSLKLVLDEGYVVSKDVYPAPKQIESDGRKIIVDWQFTNLKQDSSVPLFVIIENVKQNNYLMTVLEIMLLILVCILIVYLIRKASEKRMARIGIKKVKKVREDITKFLLDNEKKVFDEVQKEKEIWQKTLQLKTQLSKVKLSRVLKNLEKRGLIKKINFGKTNKILMRK
jgi:uncharacterized membrane protein